MFSLSNRFWVPLYLSVTLLIGWFTYVRDYDQPPYLFWDENYHIASAQKYLDGIFFQEPHPPLGKLLIALGEYLVQPNVGKDVTSFHSTDHIKTLPEKYSFKGMRLVPTVMAWLTGGLLFLALYFAIQNPHLAFAVGFFYNFDTALVLHSRSAMLEGSQLFFLIGSTALFLYLYQRARAVAWWHYLLFSLLVGAALAVKVNSTIIFLLFPVLAFVDLRARLGEFHHYPATALRTILPSVLISLVGMGAVFLSAWIIHFQLGTKVVQDRYYGASPAYKELLAKGETKSYKNLPLMLEDSYKYFANYQKGVPKLDVCKSGENGSYPVGWTVGIKSINYRWEKNKEGNVQYLYLQSNPIVWFSALGAVILGVVLVGSRLFFGLAVKDQRSFWLIVLLLITYLGYLTTMMQVDRVMYLYHYFIPLLFAFILFGLIFKQLFERELLEHNPWVYAGLVLLVGQVIAVFIFFSPFSYYNGLSTADFWRRAWISGWKLEPIL